MLPVLRAEDAMATAERVSVGTGSLKAGASTKILDGWRRDAAGAGRTITRRQVASRGDLATMGIGYRVVERR